MNRWSTMAVVLALLLAPGGSAKTVDVVAPHLDADALLARGPAAVVKAWDGAGVDLRLTAETVHAVELTERHLPSTILGDPRPPTSHYRHANHTHVNWDGQLVGEHGSLFGTGSPGASGMNLEGVAVDGRVSPVASEEAYLRPYSDGASWSAAVDGLLRLDAGSAEAELRGDFTIRLWSATVGGPTDGDDVRYESGHHEDPVGPLPSNPAVVRDRNVYLILFVTNGTLTIQAPESATLRTYLGGDSTLTPHGGRLYGVVGRVGGEAVEGTVSMQDGAPLLVSPSADGLRLRSPSSDPATSGFAGALPEPATSVPVLVLALAAATALALFLRSRRPTSVQMLLDQMDRKRYRRVVRHAGAVQRRTRSEAVSVMKVVSLLALGRAETALRYLDGLPADLRPGDGMDPFLRAHALNELGEADDARRFLTTALGENPGLAVELAALPRLRALIPDEAPPGAYA